MASAATESYRFRHALLQEAVYGDLLPGERTRLHATYARLLAAADDQTGSGSAAELAWHRLASHDLPGGLAALVSGRRGGQRVRPREAYRHLTQALELWSRVPDAEAVAGIDRVEALIRAAAAASDSGEFRQAVGLAREAVEAIDEAGRAAAGGHGLRAPQRLPARRRGEAVAGRRGDAGRGRQGRRPGPRAAPDPAAARGGGGHGPHPPDHPRLRRGPTLGRGGPEVARAAGATPTRPGR